MAVPRLLVISWSRLWCKQLSSHLVFLSKYFLCSLTLVTWNMFWEKSEKTLVIFICLLQHLSASSTFNLWPGWKMKNWHHFSITQLAVDFSQKAQAYTGIFKNWLRFEYSQVLIKKFCSVLKILKEFSLKPDPKHLNSHHVKCILWTPCHGEYLDRAPFCLMVYHEGKLWSITISPTRCFSLSPWHLVTL